MKGAREPECAPLSRASHEYHKILHWKSYRFRPAPSRFINFTTYLSWVKRVLRIYFAHPPSDSLNASPTKSASHHVSKPKKENEEAQQRDASRQWNSRQRGPTSNFKPNIGSDSTWPGEMLSFRFSWNLSFEPSNVIISMLWFQIWWSGSFLET